MTEYTRDDVLDRLAHAMDTPLSNPGSELLAREVLARFTASFPEVMAKFGDKMLETLSDGERHDTLAVAPTRDVALWFVVWPGSHHEVQASRIGEYLEQIAGKVRFLVNAGIPLETLLELDAYVLNGGGPASSAPPSGGLDVSVEYSFMPAQFFGGPQPSNPQWMTLVLNPDLLSQSERDGLGKFIT